MITLHVTISGKVPVSEMLSDKDMTSLHREAGRGMLFHIQDHLRGNGGEKFWGEAADSARLDRWDASGAEVNVYKRGVALQRYGSGGLPGGVVRPVRAKYLTIPTIKDLGPAREYKGDLVFVPDGSKAGQYAGSLCPAGMRPIKRGKRKGQSRKVVAGEPLYRLYRWTEHDPHPEGLPDQESLETSVKLVMERALRLLIRRNSRRNNPAS